MSNERSCLLGNHQVGLIAGSIIRLNDWNAAASEFEIKINDFNVRGQRDEIPHPGFCKVFTHCPECGQKIDQSKIRELDWES